MQPSRNTAKTDVKLTFSLFRHYRTSEHLMRNAYQNLSKIDQEIGYENARQKWSKNIQNWVQKCSKIDRKSIRNRCRNEHEFHAPKIGRKRRSAGADTEQVGVEPEQNRRFGAMRGAGGGGGGKASGSTEGYRKDFGLIQHAGRMRRIQTLRAFRLANPGALEA